MNRFLQRRIPICQELEDCKSQLRTAVAGMEESYKASLVIFVSIDKNVITCTI